MMVITVNFKTLGMVKTECFSFDHLRVAETLRKKKQVSFFKTNILVFEEYLENLQGSTIFSNELMDFPYLVLLEENLKDLNVCRTNYDVNQLFERGGQISKHNN